MAHETQGAQARAIEAALAALPELAAQLEAPESVRRRARDEVAAH